MCRFLVDSSLGLALPLPFSSFPRLLEEFWRWRRWGGCACSKSRHFQGCARRRGQTSHFADTRTHAREHHAAALVGHTTHSTIFMPRVSRFLRFIYCDDLPVFAPGGRLPGVLGLAPSAAAMSVFSCSRDRISRQLTCVSISVSQVRVDSIFPRGRS